MSGRCGPVELCRAASCAEASAGVLGFIPGVIPWQPQQLPARPPRPLRRPSSQLKSLSIQSASDGERWITLWKAGADSSSSSSSDTAAASSGDASQDLTSTACAEGEAVASGRFDVTCTHTYTAGLRGFAAAFSRAQLAQFLQAYGEAIDSVSLDGKVSIAAEEGIPVAATGQPSMWGLDRIDQPSLPLDGLYRYFNTGAGVHVYIIDTVRVRWGLGWGRKGSASFARGLDNSGGCRQSERMQQTEGRLVWQSQG